MASTFCVPARPNACDIIAHRRMVIAVALLVISYDWRRRVASRWREVVCVCVTTRCVVCTCMKEAAKRNIGELAIKLYLCASYRRVRRVAGNNDAR